MDIKLKISSLSRRRVGEATVRKLSISVVGFVALVSLFAYIAKSVESGSTLTRDREILLGLNTYANRSLDLAALAITYTGNILTVLVIVAAITAILYRLGKVRSLVQLLVTMIGALLTNAILKLIFQRDRPELWQLLTHESTYSFPSGHSLLTASLATVVIMLTWNTRFRWVVFILAIAYSGLVGLSRLYLGVHYPTDVLAGWILGVAWGIGVATILGTIKIRRSNINEG